MVLNMGPQHPSTHGVLRLLLELDGETVVSAVPDIGYLHTGIEKTGERLKYQQVITLTDRMGYLDNMLDELAYVLAAEKLLGIEVPERVKWIRVLLCELERISQPLRLAGHPRPRPRRAEHVHVRLPGAREDTRHKRDHQRRAHDDQLHPHRRTDGRPSRRVRAEGSRIS